MAELSAQPAPRTRGVRGRAGKGARKPAGEAQQATAAGLDLLRVLGWLVLHDAGVPGDPDGQIDHVLAGPTGVYVVNTVSWSGAISMRDNLLTVGGTDRGETLDQVVGVAEAVREVLGGLPVVPMLCFERLEPVTGVVADVALCASENILDLLTNQPEILDPAAFAKASRSLASFCRLAPPRPVRSAGEPAAPAATNGTTTTNATTSRTAALRPVTPIVPAVEESEEPRTPVVQSAEDIARVAAFERLMVGSPHVGGEHVAAQDADDSPAVIVDAGAALWRELTEPAEDVDAALAEAEARQREVEERDARELAEAAERERAAVEERERAAAEERDRATAEARAAKEALERKAREARERIEREARSLAEQEARELAERAATAKAEAEARARAEAEARAQAEREAKARAEAEARAKAEQEAREQAEQEAREQAEREAKARAEAEARARAEQEAREQAEREAKARAEAEARAKAEQEEREQAEREAKARAEQQEREQAEREAKARAEQEEREQAEREAEARADAEAKAKAEQEAREHAEQEARERAEQEARVQAELADEDGISADELARERAAWEALKQAAREERERERREHEELWAQELAAQEARVRLDQEARTRSVEPTDTAASPETVPAEAPTTPRRRPVPNKALFQVALAAALVAVVIVLAPRASGVVGWAHGLFAEDAPTTVGTAVTVKASSFHPDVDVLAGAPVDVKPAGGTKVVKGQHLVAVPLRLGNQGLVRWDVAPAAKTTVVDDLGVARRPAKGVTVKGMTLLTGTQKVAPGATVTGYLVFSVPEGRTIRSVTLNLGDSGDAATWRTAP